MLCLDEQFGQGFGIRRIPGLRPFGLGHIELVEQHGLQLLGRTKVHLVADRVIGLLSAGFGLFREFVDEVRQSGLVDGDTGRFHAREHGHERQFDVSVHLRHVRVVDSLREHLVDFEQGGGTLAVRGHRGIRVEIEGELPGIRFGFAEVDSGAVGGDLPELVGTGIGNEEVGGQSRVPGDIGHGQPHRLPGFDLQLRAVEDERMPAQCGTELADVLLPRLGEVDDPRLPGFGGDREGPCLTMAEFEGGIRIERQHIVVGDLRQQCVDVDGLDARLPCRCRLGFGAGFGEDRGQTFAEGLELELIEQARQLGRVACAPRQVIEFQPQVDVVEEAVESIVPLHLGDVVAQLLPDLAADRLCVLQHSGQVAMGGEPFGGGLVTDSGHAGQIVGLLTDESGQSSVVRGTDPVLLLDRGRSHPVEIADSALRVEDRHLVGGELERILVTAHHLDDRTGLGAHPRHRRQGVIGLEALLRHDPDAHRRDDVLDEVDLRVELGRSLRPAGLVLGVFLESEGLASEVEGHGHMAGLFVAEDVDEHGDEAVDGVRRLTGAGREVLDRQGVEGPVGQGVSVDEQEGFV